MRDQQSGRKLDNAIEVRTVELAKYNLEAGTISQASKLEQWAFLLLRAQDYDAATLKRLLPGIEFETAIETIETIEIISEKTEDKQMYDQREKAQRDYEWALSGAREEGERLGMKKGKSTGQVQLLQELLGDTPSSDKELQELGFDALADQLTVLQQRLRDRQA